MSMPTTPSICSIANSVIATSAPERPVMRKSRGLRTNPGVVLCCESMTKAGSPKKFTVTRLLVAVTGISSIVSGIAAASAFGASSAFGATGRGAVGALGVSSSASKRWTVGAVGVAGGVTGAGAAGGVTGAGAAAGVTGGASAGAGSARAGPAAQRSAHKHAAEALEGPI